MGGIGNRGDPLTGRADEVAEIGKEAGFINLWNNF
jgi:hypothetical protein